MSQVIYLSKNVDLCLFYATVQIKPEKCQLKVYTISLGLLSFAHILGWGRGDGVGAGVMGQLQNRKKTCLQQKHSCLFSDCGLTDTEYFLPSENICSILHVNFERVNKSKIRHYLPTCNFLGKYYVMIQLKFRQLYLLFQFKLF